MIQLNWTIIIVAALVPSITGMVWYHPKVFGTAWMNLSGLSEAKLKGGNMAIMMALSLLFSFFLALSLNPIVIHQMGVYSVLAGEPGIKDPTSEVSVFLSTFMDRYGYNFRTYKHGAFHGTLVGIFMIMPVLAINGLFERKPAKLIIIHAAYWIFTLATMGALICHFK